MDITIDTNPSLDKVCISTKIVIFQDYKHESF